MIDEKKIEEAAEEYANYPYSPKTAMKNSFKSGINWFKENLWHDASEKPEAFVYILAEIEEFHKGYKVLMFHGGDPWEKLVKYNGITRWLYIEDLMKGGEVDMDKETKKVRYDSLYCSEDCDECYCFSCQHYKEMIDYDE